MSEVPNGGQQGYGPDGGPEERTPWQPAPPRRDWGPPTEPTVETGPAVPATPTTGPPFAGPADDEPTRPMPVVEPAPPTPAPVPPPHSPLPPVPLPPPAPAPPAPEPFAERDPYPPPLSPVAPAPYPTTGPGPQAVPATGPDPRAVTATGSGPHAVPTTTPGPPVDPVYADDPLADPLFGADRPSWQPRIVPSPPPQRGKIILGLVAGLVAGLVLFGTAGFFIGRSTAGPAADPTAAATATAPGSAAPSLPPYEASQAAINRTKFTGALATVGEPWLPYLGDCARSGEPDGPSLGPGEAARVACEYGNLYAYFVEYRTPADRDKTRLRRVAQNIDARELTPGAAEGPSERATPSGRTSGSYVEYAYRAGAGPAARVLAGLWWDDADSPVGAYLLAYWKDDVAESWAPMRDVWARHA